MRGLTRRDTYGGFVSVVDVGRAAAAVFESPDEYSGKEVELCSENLTGQDLADTLASVRHQRYRYKRVPAFAWRAMGKSDQADVADFWER